MKRFVGDEWTCPVCLAPPHQWCVVPNPVGEPRLRAVPHERRMSGPPPYAPTCPVCFAVGRQECRTRSGARRLDWHAARREALRIEQMKGTG